jgi:hypothetical protein
VNFSTNQSSLPLAWHCRGLASCYFQIAAGTPAAFSTRFVIDLFPGQGKVIACRSAAFFVLFAGLGEYELAFRFRGVRVSLRRRRKK